jgi:3-oxoacyl-[acyl-carrier protein] reductase
MDLGLKDKVALVAGASKGLGYAAARSLVREGVRVAICSRDALRIESAAEALHRETDAPVFAAVVDVTRAEEITRWVNGVAERFGTIHICVTNTGGPPSMPFVDLDDALWQAWLNQTLMSAVRLARAVIPYMQKQKWGRIIHLASYSVKNPVPNLMLSNSIRSAVVALGKTQADELAADGILVNCVLPGWTETERVGELMEARAKRESISVAEAFARLRATIPVKRLGRPEELGDAVAFLASERASYITGVALTVDGGGSRFPF